MFDTKIAIVLRDDLANWQKMNVVAFPDQRPCRPGAGDIGH